jgi:formamidase
VTRSPSSPRWPEADRGALQNPVLTFAPLDLVAVATRLRPFLGQIGTSPSITMPDSHNAGDFGSFLIGAPHRYALTAEELQTHKTDGHMDVDAVRAGAILVCPVKLPGAGLYLGDMHALQGDGEIAGHTCDVSGTVTLQVEVLHRLGIDGPILFPLTEDLPFLARPLSEEERMRALTLGRRYGVAELERSLPVSIIGTGPDLNSATDSGLSRAAELLGLSVPEIKNRATISGAIEIGRHPGVSRSRSGHRPSGWTPAVCSATPLSSTASREDGQQGRSVEARVRIRISP